MSLQLDEISQDVWGWVSQNAGSGADATGDIADFLIQAGLNFAAATQLLNGIATSANATPDQVRYIQQEMQYLNQGYYQPRDDSSKLIGGLIIGALIWMAVSNDR